jgi:predicted TPR repeat methyltransferase
VSKSEKELSTILIAAHNALQAKDFSTAIKKYQLALQESPRELEALHNLSLLYVQQGEVIKAKQLLETAQQQLPNILLKQLANVYRVAGDLDLAKKTFNELLEKDSVDASSQNNLALIYYQEKNYQLAQQHFLKALEIDKSYFTAMYNLALTYKAQNKLEDAVACLLGLLSGDPDYAQANFLLGKILLEKKQTEEALKFLQRFVSQFPDDVEILQAVSVCLLEENCFQQAKPYCQALVDLQEKPFSAWYNLGVIAEKLGDKEEALNCYQNSLIIYPEYFDALNNAGVIYLEQQKIKEAQHCFEQALKLQPENESLQYTLQAITGKQTAQQSPKNYVANLFDAYADHFDEHLTKGLAYRVPSLLKAAVEEVSNKPIASMLDLGCGTGLAAAVFKESDMEITGVDLSKKMLAVAAEKGLYRKLVAADVVEFLQKDTDKYDLIIAADVFVYIGNLVNVFQAAKSRLNPGGLFAFSLENIQGVNFKLQTSGRFAHSENYIRALAKEKQLVVCFYQGAVTREQNNQDVVGSIVVLRHSGRSFVNE